MRRWILWWTLFLIVVWLLAAAAWASEEANCDTSTSLICVSQKGVWALSALYAVIVWATGLVVIALGWGLQHAWRKTRATTDVPPE